MTKYQLIKAAEFIGEIVVPAHCREPIQKVLNKNWKKRIVCDFAPEDYDCAKSKSTHCSTLRGPGRPPRLSEPPTLWDYDYAKSKSTLSAPRRGPGRPRLSDSNPQRDRRKTIKHCQQKRSQPRRAHTKYDDSSDSEEEEVVDRRKTRHRAQKPGPTRKPRAKNYSDSDEEDARIHRKQKRRQHKPETRGTRAKSDTSESEEEEPAAMFPFRRNTPVPSRTPGRSQDAWPPYQHQNSNQSFSQPAFGSQFSNHSLSDSFAPKPFGESDTNFGFGNSVGSDANSQPRGTQPSGFGCKPLREDTMLDQADDVLAALDDGNESTVASAPCRTTKPKVQCAWKAYGSSSAWSLPVSNPIERPWGGNAFE